MPPILSPFLQQQRFQAIAPYLRGDVLDLGCGYAAVRDQLRPGQAYVGVEQAPDRARRLKELHPDAEFHARDLECDELALGRRFDTVLALAVVEHLRRPDWLLRQAAGCLQPEGQLVLTTPTPLGHLVHHAGARLGLFYLDAAQDHKLVFDRRRLLALLADCGWHAIHYRPFLFGGNQLAVCRASEPGG